MGIPFPGRTGGPPTHLPYLVGYFEDQPGFAIRTFFFGGASDRDETVTARIIHTCVTWARFLWLLATFRPQIVHLNTAFDKKTVLRDIPFSLTCFILRKKLMLKFHGSFSELISTQHIVWQSLNRTVMMGASRIGVLSGPEREEFVRFYGSPEKFVVVRNIVAVKPPLTTGKPAFTREEGKIAGLYAGRIIRKKGLNDVISALPAILKNRLNFILVIAGDGPDLDEAQLLAKKLEVSHAVRWLGYISNDDLNLVFPQTDFLIFASKLPEGMPMVIFDAMKNGLPVITTPVRFASAYFREPVNCIFISPGDPDSVAAGVEKMICNSGMRAEMISNNMKMISEFSPEQVGAAFAEIYRGMAYNK